VKENKEKRERNEKQRGKRQDGSGMKYLFSFRFDG
jgi:hypothetical protein